MFLTLSFWRKAVATLGAIVGFVFAYEAIDPRSRAFDARRNRRVAEPGSRLHFTATAYCKGETTASGVTVRTGVAAADPTLLPVGTVVTLDMPDGRYDGVWTIVDTGPAVQGRLVDPYMWSCHEALKFGRRPVQAHGAAPRLESGEQRARTHWCALLQTARDGEPAIAGGINPPDPAGITPTPFPPPINRRLDGSRARCSQPSRSVQPSALDSGHIHGCRRIPDPMWPPGAQESQLPSR